MSLQADRLASLSQDLTAAKDWGAKPPVCLAHLDVAEVALQNADRAGTVLDVTLAKVWLDVAEAALNSASWA
jgi:hypothetical protein